MAKPKIVTKSAKSQVEESMVDLKLETKVNDHISNEDIHINQQDRDNISYLRKDLDKHTNSQNIHVTPIERYNWDSKETVAGAQAKANRVQDSLTAHKEDFQAHTTKAEKVLFADKYTRAETRNLVKHTLTGLTFLPSVSNKLELDKKYPKPEFNSCVYSRNEKITLIYNGKQWVEFNGIFTPEVTIENDGLMTSEEKVKLDSIEEGANNYVHPDNVDTRHVSDSQIDYWTNKADNVLVSNTVDGLMSKDDKEKLDSIQSNANYYEHPETHLPSIIEEDADHKFVSDEQISKWDSKAEVSYVDNSVNKTLMAANAFTDSKVAAMFNSTSEQLQVLRSLAFELKKDETVKQFFDLYNESAKNKDLQEHLVSNVHMSKNDRALLNNINKALETGISVEWDNVENKPVALPANGGNADTVGGYTVEQLLDTKCFYDYIIDSVESIESVIDFINKGKGYNILIKPGSYLLDKELVIKASNITISGIGAISKLLNVSIKVIGNNNIIENITFANGKDSIVNKTAIYVEGNDNVIRFNNIYNYKEGILIEGSNNIIENNTLLNIKGNAIKLTADSNSNSGNDIDNNTIKNSNIGITLLSSENTLMRNHITKNKVYNCSTGIILSNTVNNIRKTMANIINENMVIRGRGESTDYTLSNKTIISEFSSKNIINSNITLGKEIISLHDTLSNNIF